MSISTSNSIYVDMNRTECIERVIPSDDRSETNLITDDTGLPVYDAIPVEK